MMSSGRLVASDLLPGVYEGGFKLWECAVDLAAYLCEYWDIRPGLEGLADISKARGLQGMKALELGCGHGLPGILAAMLGMEVHFQDYNKEVLTSLTAPNLLTNIKRTPNAAAAAFSSARFVAGGWGSLKQLLLDKQLAGTYDYIFSSDTIYSLSSQEQLLECIKEALKPKGIAFIAAKSYYFGVGGSVEGFKALAKKNGAFRIDSKKEFRDGMSNRREIFIIVKN